MIFHEEKKLRWVANWSYRHYQLVLGSTLILGLLSGLLVSRLQFQSDVINLLPSNAPATRAFVQFLQEFGAADSLFIVLERKSGGDVETFSPFAEVLGERLMASGEVREIHGLRDPAIEASIEKQFIPKALLYLTEEELHLMEHKLQDTAIEQQIRALKTRFHSSPLAAEKEPGAVALMGVGFSALTALTLLPVLLQKLLPKRSSS